MAISRMCVSMTVHDDVLMCWLRTQVSGHVSHVAEGKVLENCAFHKSTKQSLFGR